MNISISEKQIKKHLQRVDSGVISIAELCRQVGISRSTFYRWRDQYSQSDNQFQSDSANFKPRVTAAVKRAQFKRTGSWTSITTLLKMAGWQDECFMISKVARTAQMDVDFINRHPVFRDHRSPANVPSLALETLIPIDTKIRFQRGLLDLPIERPSLWQWFKRPIYTTLLNALIKSEGLKYEMQALWSHPDGSGRKATELDIKNFDWETDYQVAQYWTQDISRMGVAVKKINTGEIFYFRTTIFCFTDLILVHCDS